METVIQKLKELNTEWSTNTLNAFNRCVSQGLEYFNQFIIVTNIVLKHESLSLNVMSTSFIGRVGFWTSKTRFWMDSVQN